METTQLIHLQLAMECIGFDQHGLLIRIPGPDPDDIARVKVFRHEGGYSLYFCQDLASPVREWIQAKGPHFAFTNPAAVKAILDEHSPRNEAFAGQTYQFPDTLEPGQFPDVIRLTAEHRPLIEEYQPGMKAADRGVFAIVQDGLIVSTCSSARESAQAAEAYVYTVAEHRRRGFGRQVTAAWAVHIRDCGKIPLYSHAWENATSQGVAQSLNLLPRFACANYS